MAQLVSNIAETNIEQASRYLLPVDFMHLIETSRYLYGRHKGEIQEKRKHSLVRFQGNNGTDDVRAICSHMFRGTKLPNGKMEGKFELFDSWYYMTADYTDGNQVGYEFTYEYLQYEGGLIPNKDREAFRNNLGSKFLAWENIDASEMKLVGKVSADMRTYGVVGGYYDEKNITERPRAIHSMLS